MSQNLAVSVWRFGIQETNSPAASTVLAKQPPMPLSADKPAQTIP